MLRLVHCILGLVQVGLVIAFFGFMDMKGIVVRFVVNGLKTGLTFW